MIPQPNNRQPARTSRLSDGSETESDDEPVVAVTTVSGNNSLQSEPLETRPNFRPGPTQKHLGPLVLDQRKHIQVPSPINRFLRDYQREGVAFLYDKFRNSMGGMLGDDMGLVGLVWSSARMGGITHCLGSQSFCSLHSRARQFKLYHFCRQL